MHKSWLLVILKGKIMICLVLAGKDDWDMFHKPCMDGLERHLVNWLAVTGWRHRAVMVKE